MRRGSSDSHFIFHRVVIRASEAVRCNEALGMRRACPIHPKSFIETDIVDDERVAFPVASGIAVAGTRLAGCGLPSV
jgi:hypothetical protein